MGLLGRIAARLAGPKPEAPGPGPTNTTSLVLTDPFLRSHETDDGRAPRDHAVTGRDTFLDEPLIRWVVRDAQATARRVRVIVDDTPGEQERWERCLPRHVLATPEAQQDPALAVVPVPRDGHGRIGWLRKALDHAAPDPHVQLLDARMPNIGPDSLLLLAQRLGRHDAVAFHLDGWWVAEPSLWRTDALHDALEKAQRADLEDTASLYDRIDARPLDDGFLDAILAERDDLRAIVDEDDLRAAERRVRARRA